MPAPQRILIVKLSAVGDVVHTLPALNALRQQFPNAHIGWAVQRGAHNLLEGHPQIDELIILPRRLKSADGRMSLSDLRRMLRGTGGWDVAIDFQGLTKSGVAACLSGAPTRIGLGNKWSRELNRVFMTRRVNATAMPVIQMNLELLAPLMPVPEEATAILHTAPADEEKIRQWIASTQVQGKRWLVLDPFAGWESKLWPQEHWVEVAAAAMDRFNLLPMVFFGPGEEQNARDLLDQIMLRAIDSTMAPQTSLREYVALLRQCAAAFVGADTGPMHIAAAAGVPTVAMFGPSDSRRNAPTFTNANYRTLQDFSQPCAGTFTRNCKFHAKGECMRPIQPEQVLTALEEITPRQGR